MASSKPLSEITVAITGAAGGLGKAIAQTFLDAGSKVAICDVNQERLDQVKEEWKAHEGRILVSRTDITDEAEVEAFVQGVTEKLGGLDIFINNAGIMDKFDAVATTPKAVWDRVIGVNATGAFLCTKSAVNVMLASGTGGTIISIASNASIYGVASGVAYTASKHALLGLVRNTAGFYGDKGVYSVALVLGGMDTTNLVDAFREGINMEVMGKMKGFLPGYVPGETGVEPADVAKYCVFLADRAVARASNGGTINVNNNWPTI
ncbi:hypothetical protein V2G26_011089 [Clonostachys chloroleuca]|uniref:Uncharacterized protein n=1 Tax=Clonostachys chloroleuca TaxID=1926264 RepID=A0AA35LR65_9HYPO|nr:unnamed protein product [Clonostachys chloroleuca]